MLWSTASRTRRFIPTPVGNMARLSAAPASPPVHPHACGEHLPKIRKLADQLGSSPRLWGTCLGSVRIAFSLRFIPTPVGNIGYSDEKPRIEAVHPHACGEHPVGYANPSSTAGSSPRLWGTWKKGDDAIRRFRFIPTPVGNITIFETPPSRKPVHPHACGEHGKIPLSKPSDFGSSPRLWGT